MIIGPTKSIFGPQVNNFAVVNRVRAAVVAISTFKFRPRGHYAPGPYLVGLYHFADFLNAAEYTPSHSPTIIMINYSPKYFVTDGN